ncbi:MAG: GNAT family N-acetyltransferase [Oscillospiraceae bacterium]|nr:GNAT family N-acetyltransferase [Oscillospiraceae bacterium]
MMIREFFPSDYNAAYALWQNSKGICMCAKCAFYDSEAELVKFLTRNPNTCFIAEENGQVIGTILAGHDSRSGIIYRLAVAEEFQGRGTGKALVSRAVEALHQEGVTVSMAFVLCENEEGNAFWEKAGFKEETKAATRKHRYKEKD